MTSRSRKESGPSAGSERTLKEQRDRLQRQFTLFASLSRRMAASLDPRQVLREVVEAACELLDAKYGALGVFGADGRIHEFVTHGISARDRAKIGDLPQGKGLLGFLQRHPTPLRVAEISKHRESFGFPPNHPSMTTFMGVPIAYEREYLGNL